MFEVRLPHGRIGSPGIRDRSVLIITPKCSAGYLHDDCMHPVRGKTNILILTTQSALLLTIDETLAVFFTQHVFLGTLLGRSCAIIRAADFLSLKIHRNAFKNVRKSMKYKIRLLNTENSITISPSNDCNS